MRELLLILRRLIRAPIFVGVSIATLGLAIGLTAAVFSIADAVLFRPLPYAHPEQLYFLRLVNRQTGQTHFLVPRALTDALEARGGVSAGVAVRGPVQNSPHTGADGTELIGNIAVAPNFLNTLGVRPIYGRPFDSRDLSQPGRSVLLTYQSWRDRFGGNLGVIGQSMMIAGYQRDIVGVLPRDFVFPSEGVAYAFAAPGRPRYEFVAVAAPRGRNTETPLVRLKAGVTSEVAETEIESVAQSLAPGFEARLVALRPVIFPVGTLPLRILLLAASFVLLLGCVNLSHLFLIRVQQRQHEVRVCLALGATRLRIVTTLFLEALIIGLCGAAIALSIALVSFSALRHQVPLALSGGAAMSVDGRVALFTVVLGVASALLFTALPAWTLATASMQGTIFTGRPELQRKSLGGFGTVILQVAVAMVLVSMAVAATRHFVSMLRQPLGFSPENVLTIDALLPSAPDDPSRTFTSELVRRLAERSDVQSAGAVEALPLSGWIPRDIVPVPGAEPIPLVRTLPGYFETAGIRLLQGRQFNWQDTGAASPAIVSESAASILFPGLDALGQSVKAEKSGLFTVIGVVGDVRMTLGRPRDPLIYTFVGPPFDGRMDFLARLRAQSPQAAAEIRKFVSSLQREMPVSTAWWSESINAMSEYRTPRFQSMVLGTVATLATALAAIGLFGVVSYSTRRRMREIAIRLALGARPESITRTLVLQKAWPVAIGLMVGLIGTWLMNGVLTATLVGFRGWDWPVLTSGASIILFTAMLSTYLPVRKASRLPAMTVLRSL
jgi:putative ABC transport system permease protein